MKFAAIILLLIAHPANADKTGLHHGLDSVVEKQQEMTYLRADSVESEVDFPNLHSSIVVANSGGGANTIEICATEMNLVTERPSEGATVKCYDKDIDPDDLMAEGLTGADGCATMKYNNEMWDYGITSYARRPDIYCQVEKLGFVTVTCPDKDHHDPSTLAKMDNVILRRDRIGDYGHDNGCGPLVTEWTGLNDLASWVLQFGEQCTHHDKCYSDCQILNAEGSAEKAQAFCDEEMFEGMLSFCYANNGHLPGLGEDGCITRARAVYEGLKQLAKGAYTFTLQKCDVNAANKHGSFENDYSLDRNCHGDGYECGYDGTFGDDLDRCNYCCNKPPAIDGGMKTDEYYCKCFPTGTKCGSTLFTNSFDNCGKCCSREKTEDEGWTYSDYHCK